MEAFTGRSTRDLDRQPDRLPLQLGDGFGHHANVEVVADGADVAGLVAPEQVAGAANLEVAHGDLEPEPSSVCSPIVFSRS